MNLGLMLDHGRKMKRISQRGLKPPFVVVTVEAIVVVPVVVPVEVIDDVCVVVPVISVDVVNV
jgi:hypothetical protein